MGARDPHAVPRLHAGVRSSRSERTWATWTTLPFCAKSSLACSDSRSRGLVRAGEDEHATEISVCLSATTEIVGRVGEIDRFARQFFRDLELASGRVDLSRIGRHIISRFGRPHSRDVPRGASIRRPR